MRLIKSTLIFAIAALTREAMGSTSSSSSVAGSIPSYLQEGLDDCTATAGRTQRGISELMAAKFCLAHTDLALKRYMNQITAIDSDSPIVLETAELRAQLVRMEEAMQTFVNFPLPVPQLILGMAPAIRYMSIQKRIFDRFVAISSLEADSPVIKFYKDQSAVLDRAIAGMMAFLTEYMETSNLEGLRDTIPAAVEELISETAAAMDSGYSRSTVATIVPEEVQIEREWARRAAAPAPFDFTSLYSNVIRIGSAPSRPVSSPDSALFETFFNRIKEIAPTPELLITNTAIKAQVRLIGQEIYNQKGHEGMVAVCEFNRQYKPFIERAWDGIGRWLA